MITTSYNPGFVEYLESISKEDITQTNFKSNTVFNGVMESLSKTHGNNYLQKIEEEFPEITFDDMKEFVSLNEKVGSAMKTIFTTKKTKLFYCSPTTMRYIYHSLIILKYLKETGLSKIVEIGSGYGGLYLAMNVVAKKMDITL